MAAKLQRLEHGMYGMTYYEDTDYTGRWKIVTNKTHNRKDLYIECFELEEVEYEKTVWLKGTDYVYKYWYDFFRGKLTPEDRIYPFKVNKTKIHAKVEWVSSEYLTVVYDNEEFINTCQGVCE